MGLKKPKAPKSNQTVTQKSEPWAAQQPYLTDLFSRAKANSQDLPEYFPGSTVAGRSADTTSSLGMMREAARGMQPGIDQTFASAMFNLGQGRDVASNPYVQGAIQAAMNPVLDSFQSAGGPLSQIRSRFIGANSGGSGTREGVATAIASNQLGRTLSDMSARMSLDAYNQAQNQALQTMQMMPQMLAMQAMPGQLMGQVGASQDAYAQQLLNDQVARHNFNENRQTEALKNYAALISGNFGQSTTGTTTNVGQAPQTSPLSQGLGGALSGAMLGSMLGGPMMPFAIGGGLLGLLG